MSSSTGTVVFNDAKIQSVDVVATEGLGVGTINPQSNLHVVGNAYVTSNMVIDDTLDVTGEMNLRPVSNTASIKYNSNVVTEYVRSKKLIKYPREALTSASQNGYVVTASRDVPGTYDKWDAFNNLKGGSSNDVGWHTSTGSIAQYTGTDNIYSGTEQLSTETDSGEWIAIELPISIKLIETHIWSQFNYAHVPKGGVFYAKNDASDTWTELYRYTDDVITSQYAPNKYQIDTNEYFKYFAFVVTHRYQSGEGISIGEWELYGIPEYDPEAHGTDVIARSVPNVPNTDWLEMYYDAGNVSSYSGSGTTVTDLSGNALNGTLTNGVGFENVNGIKSFTFDGLDDYIVTSLPNGASGEWLHSVSVWFNIQETGATHVFFQGGTASSYNSFGAYIESSGTIKVYFYNSDVRVVGFYPNTNEWYNLTYAYKGGNTTTNTDVYVNGIKFSTEPTQTPGSTLNLTGNNLRIGGDTVGNYNVHPYKVANFRLFNRALTADEVWQLYAYQKEYFQVSPDVVTFKGGRLGIGTSEPQAVLDVMGDVRYIKLTPRPAVSARQLFLNGTTQDGVYPISGVDGGTAYPVYCKMDPQHYGGFWMCFAQIPINTSASISFFSDAYGNSGDLLATNLFSVPVSILSNNAYGTDIDVMLEVDGRGMRRTTGNKVGGIWRGIYLSQAFNTAHTGTVSTSTHAYSDDGISWTNGGTATFTHSNSDWNLAISTSGGGDYAYNDYNEGKGGWIIHRWNNQDFGSIYGRAMRGNDAIDMGNSTDWAVARIFVRPTQT